MSNSVVISTGSNLNDRAKMLHLAANYVRNLCGEIVSISSIYESKSWGYEGQDFYNQVLVVETELELMQIFLSLKRVEKDLGKETNSKDGYEDRPIDIDILFFNEQIVNKEFLQIPHPRLHLRNFVLDPLMELNPEWIHPELRKTIRELKNECPDTNPTVRVNE